MLTYKLVLQYVTKYFVKFSFKFTWSSARSKWVSPKATTVHPCYEETDKPPFICTRCRDRCCSTTGDMTLYHREHRASVLIPLDTPTPLDQLQCSMHKNKTDFLGTKPTDINIHRARSLQKKNSVSVTSRYRMSGSKDITKHRQTHEDTRWSV